MMDERSTTGAGEVAAMEPVDAAMADTRPRGMVVSVGGTVEPVLVSLRAACPIRVLFVVSKLSAQKVQEEIAPVLPLGTVADYCDLSDENNLESCYRELRDEIRRWLRRTRLDARHVCVDFTGGTKAMSAAIALAGTEYFSQFAYVAGRTRSKGGVGVVETGSEYVVHTSNPWEVEAWKERERAAWLYAAVLPTEAARVLYGAKERCRESTGHQLNAYAQLLELLAMADHFEFPKLERQWKRHRSIIRTLLAGSEDTRVSEQIERLMKHWEMLEKHWQDPENVQVLLLELLCNADRRARQSRWDDAVARLYRATELWVQGIGYEAFQAKFGHLAVDRIAAERRPAFVEKFGDANEQGVYVMPLMRLVEAIEAFSEHPRRKEVAASYALLSAHLSKRNESILAHGTRPADENDYRTFLAVLMQAIGYTAEDLPVWPDLTFGRYSVQSEVS